MHKTTPIPSANQLTYKSKWETITGSAEDVIRYKNYQYRYKIIIRILIGVFQLLGS